MKRDLNCWIIKKSITCPSLEFQIRVVNMVTKCGRFYITTAYFLLFLLGRFYIWVSTRDDYSSFEMVTNMWTVPSRFCPKTQWNMGKSPT